MSYRSLLVVLDERESAAARVDLAVQLARRFDAHLVGLAPTGRVTVPIDGALGVAGPGAFEPVWEGLRQRAEAQAQAFRERCAAAGLKSHEAVVDDDEAAPSIVRHGHCSDLVVLGQADPGDAGGALAQAVVEEAVMNASRPILLVPYVGAPEHLPENVLVAWNDSREAARAIADAMPLLCLAKQVRVLKWSAPDEGDEEAATARIEALRRWLMWHGVDADVRREVTSIDVGNALLSRATDFGAHLIVMGGYGHSRWSERVLGGATRTLLTSMTVPVLMSH